MHSLCSSCMFWKETPQPLIFRWSFSDHSIKEGGGIRPITVGQTLRRLAARYVSSCIAGPLGSFLALHQLGFGIALSCEAAAHAAQRFLC